MIPVMEAMSALIGRPAGLRAIAKCPMEHVMLIFVLMAPALVGAPAASSKDPLARSSSGEMQC
jgi:hypothetical protein